MRFATIENRRAEAQPGLKGFCPGCFQPVVAKCGEQRIYHWAHLNNRTCDNWWESETEWHRTWKNYFPSEWQEIFLHDIKTGVKHVADVLTNNGLIVEFQHSHIDPVERLSREQFYKNMIWVIDGNRLKRDFLRFFNNADRFEPLKNGIFKVNFPEECFPVTWIESSVPVILDFRIQDVTENHEMRNNLYCLFPKRLAGSAILLKIAPDIFIKSIINGSWISWSAQLIANLNQVNKEWQEQKDLIQRQQANMNFERFSRSMRYHQRGRRRF